MSFPNGGPDLDPRQSILKRFRREEITREQADAEARACGFVSLEVRPDPSGFDPFSEPFWTVPMALAWIIYRSPDSVRELMETYRAECLVWRHTGNWPADSVGKEWKDIFALLPPERMDMFDVTNNASRREDQSSLVKTGPVAREEFWRSMKLRSLIAEGVASGETSHKPIRDAEWETFSWQPDPSIPEDALAGWCEKEPRYRRVFVRSADVIELWPALDAANPPVEQQVERNAVVAQIPSGEVNPKAVEAREVTITLIKNSTDIRNAILSVYEFALQQNTAVPNSREMPRFVNTILADRQVRAGPTQIRNLAASIRKDHDVAGGKYQRLFCGRGEPPTRKGLKHFGELKVISGNAR